MGSGARASHRRVTQVRQPCLLVELTLLVTSVTIGKPQLSFLVVVIIQSIHEDERIPRAYTEKLSVGVLALQCCSEGCRRCGGENQDEVHHSVWSYLRLLMLSTIQPIPSCSHSRKWRLNARCS